MSLSADNHKKNHSYSKTLTGYGEGDKGSSTEEFSWGAFTYSLSPVGISVYAPEDVLAIILLEPVRNLRWNSGSGDDVTSSCSVGTVLIIPAHQGSVVTWPEPVEILKVVIRGGQVSESENQELAIRFGDTTDRIITFSSKQCLQVSQLILEKLQEGTTSGESYLESLYSVLLYLLARNAVVARGMSGSQPGLSSYACRQIENYLKANFCSPISVPEMAMMLNMSAGHFSTCFRESFGLMPHQYLMGLRLDEAEKCLMETDLPISEIAARLSFSSQSHLTTALKKYRKLTPGEIRRRGNQQHFRKMRK